MKAYLWGFELILQNESRKKEVILTNKRLTSKTYMWKTRKTNGKIK